MKRSSRALLLVIHGTRDRSGLGEIKRFVRSVRRRAVGAKVEFALLAPGASSVPAVLQRMLNSGIRRVDVVPFLLFSGLHVRRDIPGMLTDFERKHSAVRLRYAKHIGPSKEVVQIALDRWKALEKAR